MQKLVHEYLAYIYWNAIILRIKCTQKLYSEAYTNSRVIPTLVDESLNDVEAATDKDKAEMLNKFFTTYGRIQYKKNDRLLY